MWEKAGLVYCAQGDLPWRQSHAFIPAPYLLSDEVIRLYVAFLDAAMIGRIGYVDVSAGDPTKVLGVSDTPALDIGAAGRFDDHGVTAMTVTTAGGELRLYYTGWQLDPEVRYRLFTGLARSTDGGETFTRTSDAPILGSTDAERTIRTAAHVVCEGGLWKMWYIGGSETIVVNGKQVPTYDMRYLESADGKSWGPRGRVVLAPDHVDEYGFGRPYVLRTSSGYEMWYSVRTRSRGYHLGYAVSGDGLQWARQDHLARLAPTAADSDSNWDAQMQAFTAIVDCKYGRYLFYNGNDYGRTGFGVARWR